MQTGVVPEYRDRRIARERGGREGGRKRKPRCWGWMMTVTVLAVLMAAVAAAAGGRVLLLVITTFVASTARGAGRSPLRESSRARVVKLAPSTRSLARKNTLFLPPLFLLFLFFFFCKWRTLSELITSELARVGKLAVRLNIIIRDRDRCFTKARGRGTGDRDFLLRRDSLANTDDSVVMGNVVAYIVNS